MAEKELELNIFKKKGGSKFTIFLYVVIAFLAVLVVFFNFVSLCDISGTSMNYTLHDGQNVLLLNTKSVSNGDIVVFDYGDRALIKRVIASENDKLAFVADAEGNAAVYLFDGGEYKKINEDYIASSPEPMKASWFASNVLAHAEELTETLEIDEEFVIEVPKGYLFVMGDNREVSYDSRAIGMIEKSAVYGRMIYRLKSGSFLEKVFLFLYGASTAH